MLDVLLHRLDRNAHAFRDHRVGQTFEAVQHERFAASQRQVIDDGDQRRYPLLRRHRGFRLPVSRAVRLVGSSLRGRYFHAGADVAVALVVDDKIAGSLVEQCARITNARSRSLSCIYTRITLLRQIGRNSAVGHFRERKLSNSR